MRAKYCKSPVFKRFSFKPKEKNRSISCDEQPSKWCECLKSSPEVEHLLAGKKSLFSVCNLTWHGKELLIRRASSLSAWWSIRKSHYLRYRSVASRKKSYGELRPPAWYPIHISGPGTFEIRELVILLCPPTLSSIYIKQSLGDSERTPLRDQKSVRTDAVIVWKDSQEAKQ